MARPRGFQLNYDAFEDLRISRGRSKSQIAEDAGVSLPTISGLIRRGEDRKGASLDVAIRIAGALSCKPGTLFPDLMGKVDDGTEAVA